MRRRKIAAVILGGLLISMFHARPAGGQVTVHPDGQTGTVTNISCGTTATLALSANARRRSFSLKALGSNTADTFVGFTNAVTTGTGIPLGAGSVLNDATYIGAVYCIVVAGTQTLRTAETAR